MIVNKFWIVVGLIGFVATAQNNNTLIKINGIPYSVEEFERNYTKNIDIIKDVKQKDIDNYLEMFILYKLKLQKAQELGMDKEEDYKKEFETYRSQLVEKYMIDENKLNQLTKEAYERASKEREAKHILIKLNEYALPKDTLAAYNKALNILEEIKSGKTFDSAAVEYSDDPSAKINKGYLGYFSVFRMVYPFENAAYNTPVGQISQPVRTQFGYHLINVTNEIPMRYARDLSIIYIDAQKDNAAKKVREVYNKLQKGEDFATLIKQYCDDPLLIENNGILTGYMPSNAKEKEFDEAIYAIKNEGEYTQPLKNDYGYYIIKVDKIYPYPQFDEMKSHIKQQVISDNRAKILKEDLIKSLKNRYAFNTTNHLSTAMSKITDDLKNNDWQKPNYDEIIAKYDNQIIKSSTFYNYIAQNKKDVINERNISAEELKNILWEKFIAKELENYYSSKLEIYYPDFKYLIQEYQEGILLFNFMDKEVWSKTKDEKGNFNSNEQEKYETEYVNKLRKKAVIEVNKHKLNELKKKLGTKSI